MASHSTIGQILWFSLRRGFKSLWTRTLVVGSVWNKGWPGSRRGVLWFVEYDDAAVIVPLTPDIVHADIIMA